MRIRIERADEIRFLVQREDGSYVADARPLFISRAELGFATDADIKFGQELSFSLQFKRKRLDLTGKVVRLLGGSRLACGVELDEDEDEGIVPFIEALIGSFSLGRARECLVESALQEDSPERSVDFSEGGLGLRQRMLLLERDILLAEIKRQRGNKSKAARTMGISREALRKKLSASQRILDELKAA